jgi:hypothetical protein
MLPVTADLPVRPAGALDGTVDLHLVAEGSNKVALGERAA